MNTPRILAAIDNPLDGVLPNFTIFGAEFTALWQKLLGGIWAIGIIACVVLLIVSLVQMGQAAASQNPGAHAEGRKKAMGAGIALGCLAALAVIVGAILTVVGG